ncbi:MAG: DUF2752 domain-containing protein [Planctomycetota bacterium]
MTDEEEREAARKLRKHHATYLGMALVVLVLSFVLREDTEVVRLPLVGTPLPPLCPLKFQTGWDCPGCGLTRSFVALAHGDLAKSWAHHRIGIALFAITAYQLVYRTFMIVKGEDRIERLVPVHRWIGRALIAALLANWALKALHF